MDQPSSDDLGCELGSPGDGSTKLLRQQDFNSFGNRAEIGAMPGLTSTLLQVSSSQEKNHRIQDS